MQPPSVAVPDQRRHQQCQEQGAQRRPRQADGAAVEAYDRQAPQALPADPPASQVSSSTSATKIGVVSAGSRGTPQATTAHMTESSRNATSRGPNPATEPTPEAGRPSRSPA